MTDKSTLIDKRKELKNQIKVGNYSTLPDIILYRIGWLIKKLTQKNKIPNFWFSGTILFLVILLTGILLLYIMNDSHPFKETITILVVIAIATGFISMIVGKIFVDRIFSEFRAHIIDTIQSVADLIDLQNWFVAVCNTRYQLICGLLYGLVMPIAISIVLLQTQIDFIGVGPIILLIFPTFQAGLFAYYIILYLVLPGRLSHYQYKLYLNDPSQSNVIDYLSSILTYGLFLFSIFMTISSLSVSYMWSFFSNEVRIFSLSILWIPIIAIFFINQSALSKIVKQSKMRKLSEIQARIEKLEREDDIANKETIEAINRLMDYHDRIRDSKGSTLNVRSILNFINSLLLPLISALLSRISEVLGFFK